jgi:small-conductance mechanosensitive channel
VLKKVITNTGAEPGRIQVIDRLTDAALLLLATFVLLEILNLKMGVAVKGVVAVGSVWTLVASLAVKEIVSNFFHGILLSASDRIYEGDSIRLSESGFKGTVARLGWLETVLRGTDNTMITIPNTQLQGDQVANLSRINVCQVHQTLRFPYRLVPVASASTGIVVRSGRSWNRPSLFDN